MTRVFLCLAACLWWAIPGLTAEPAPGLQAGVTVVNINPPQLPVLVNGGMTSRSSDRVLDSLHARALVLEQAGQRVAICVVDSCMLPRELLDEAKQRVEQTSGLAVERIMISATHTHSAPAAMGCLGTDADPAYVEFLPGMIARAILEAEKKLEPAQVAVTTTEVPEHVFCRRWLMQPGTAQTNPFGGTQDDRAQMNPGFNNANKIRPLGKPDTTVTILAVQTRAGDPLAVLANYSTHYAGVRQAGLSSDYFGVFCELLENHYGENSPRFRAMISNGTSGDANCHDFTKPPERVDHREVAQTVADRTIAALKDLEYRSDLPVAMLEKQVTFRIRKPTENEVRAAQDYLAEHRPEGLPRNVPEVYARETLLLAERPAERELRLQALRIGPLAVTAIPCEVYSSTGLTLKKDSPFAVTMNVSLANGADGYLPPPEQHPLGGYTTWRARTSCLEVEAEPRIRAVLLELLNALAENE